MAFALCGVAAVLYWQACSPLAMNEAFHIAGIYDGLREAPYWPDVTRWNFRPSGYRVFLALLSVGPLNTVGWTPRFAAFFSVTASSLIGLSLLLLLNRAPLKEAVAITGPPHRSVRTAARAATSAFIQSQHERMRVMPAHALLVFGVLFGRDSSVAFSADAVAGYVLFLASWGVLRRSASSRGTWIPIAIAGIALFLVKGITLLLVLPIWIAVWARDGFQSAFRVLWLSSLTIVIVIGLFFRGDLAMLREAAAMQHSTGFLEDLVEGLRGKQWEACWIATVTLATAALALRGRVRRATLAGLFSIGFGFTAYLFRAEMSAVWNLLVLRGSAFAWTGKLGFLGADLSPPFLALVCFIAAIGWGRDGFSLKVLGVGACYAISVIAIFVGQGKPWTYHLAPLLSCLLLAACLTAEKYWGERWLVLLSAAGVIVLVLGMPNRPDKHTEPFEVELKEVPGHRDDEPLLYLAYGATAAKYGYRSACPYHSAHPFNRLTEAELDLDPRVSGARAYRDCVLAYRGRSVIVEPWARLRRHPKVRTWLRAHYKSTKNPDILVRRSRPK